MTAVIGMSYKFFQVWRTINPWGRVARRAVEDAGPCECGGGLCALRLGRRLRPHVGMRPCGRQADGNALSNRSPHPSRLRRAAFPRLGKALRGDERRGRAHGCAPLRVRRGGCGGRLCRRRRCLRRLCCREFRRRRRRCRQLCCQRFRHRRLCRRRFRS